MSLYKKLKLSKVFWNLRRIAKAVRNTLSVGDTYWRWSTARRQGIQWLCDDEETNAYVYVHTQIITCMTEIQKCGNKHLFGRIPVSMSWFLLNISNFLIVSVEIMI